MAAKKGNALTILRWNGTAFVLLAGARSKNLRVGGEPIDTTTDDDILGGVSWRTFIPGIIDFEQQVDGVAKDDAAMKLIIADSLSGAQVDYQVNIADIGTFEGAMILTGLTFNAEYTDTLTFSVTLKAAEALTFTPV